MTYRNPTIDDLADRTFACVATELKIDQPDKFPNPRVKVRLKIVEGEFTGYDGLIFEGGLGSEPVGARKVFIPLDHTLKSLRLMGWKGNDLSKACDEGLGVIKCSIVTKVRSYASKKDGRQRRTVEVKYVNQYGVKSGELYLHNEVGGKDLAALVKRVATEAKLVPVVTVSESNAAPPAGVVEAATEAATEAAEAAAPLVAVGPATIKF